MGSQRGWSYYFIDLRRRYLNDRTWFGLALITVGVGNGLGGTLPWWLCVPVGLLGAGLLAWGVSADDRWRR